MNLLFIVKRFYTGKDLIEDQFGRLFHFPVQLAKNGHQCTVIAIDLKTTVSRYRTIEGVHFYSLPIFKALFFPDIKKIIKQMPAAVDIVFASGDSYVGFWGSKVASREKARFVFDLYDDYSEFSLGRRLPLMNKLLKIAVKKSELVISASEAIAVKYKPLAKKIVVVPNGIDSAIFFKADKNRLREIYKYSNTSTIVGYFGSLHKLRGTDILIEAMQIVRKQMPDAILLMAGKRLDATDFNYPWIHFLGMVEQKQVGELINLCDVVTLPYRNYPVIQMTNACKIYEYIACQVPMVVTDVADYAGFFAGDSRCVAEPDSATSLADAIIYQIDNGHILPFQNNYQWESLAAKLEQSLAALIFR